MLLFMAVRIHVIVTMSNDNPRDYQKEVKSQSRQEGGMLIQGEERGKAQAMRGLNSLSESRNEGG